MDIGLNRHHYVEIRRGDFVSLAFYWNWSSRF